MKCSRPWRFRMLPRSSTIRARSMARYISSRRSDRSEPLGPLLTLRAELDIRLKLSFLDTFEAGTSRIIHVLRTTNTPRPADTPGTKPPDRRHRPETAMSRWYHL